MFILENFVLYIYFFVLFWSAENLNIYCSSSSSCSSSHSSSSFSSSGSSGIRNVIFCYTSGFFEAAFRSDFSFIQGLVSVLHAEIQRFLSLTDISKSRQIKSKELTLSWSAFVFSCVRSVTAMDPCGFSVTAQCPPLCLPAGDLQAATSRHHPTDGAHTEVSLRTYITMLTAGLIFEWIQQCKENRPIWITYPLQKNIKEK